MKKRPDFELIKKNVVEVLRKHHIKRAGIFGSYARGRHRSTSDVDIIIEPRKGMGFEFFGLQLELEKKLGKRVDLVSYRGVSPYLKEYILKDEVRIL